MMTIHMNTIEPPTINSGSTISTQYRSQNQDVKDYELIKNNGMNWRENEEFILDGMEQPSLLLEQTSWTGQIPPSIELSRYSDTSQKPGAYRMRGTVIMARGRLGIMSFPDDRETKEIRGSHTSRSRDDHNATGASRNGFELHKQDHADTCLPLSKGPSSTCKWLFATILVLLILVPSILSFLIWGKEQNPTATSHNLTVLLSMCETRTTNHRQERGIDLESAVNPNVRRVYWNLNRQLGLLDSNSTMDMLNNEYQYEEEEETRPMKQEDTNLISCSPQELAILTMAFHHDNDDDFATSTATAPSLLLIRYPLLVLFFATRGQSWNNQTGWLTPSDPCTWFGITCKQQGKEEPQQQIKALVLPANNLDGTLPDDLYRLTTLQELIIERNKHLGGTVSPALSSLGALTVFNIDQTNLTGSLSTQFAFLTNLQFLGIPLSLSALDTSHFGYLQKLEHLNINALQLNGTIPTELGQCTRLTSLFINGATQGTIPTEFALLSQLEELVIQPGTLSGTLPESIFLNNTNWKRFEIDHNYFGGTIPTSIGNLFSLQRLNIQNNNFHGTLPTELGRCTSLEYLNIQGNFFHGSIPSEVGTMSSLRQISLSGSEMTGTVPDELFGLSQLTRLELLDMTLSGTLPPNLCQNLPALFVVANCVIVDDQKIDECDASSLVKSCRDLKCCVA